jgi:hypothetical protein
MAVMSRKKRAVAQGWEATNKQRDEEARKSQTEEKKKELTPEEHEARIKLLKELGLIKD